MPAVTGATTRPLVNGGQRRQSTVTNDGQWRRTTAGPPPDHRSTTGQRRLTASQPVSHGWVWSGSGRVLGRVRSGLGPGLDRVGSGSVTWHATWYHVSVDVAADVAWMGYYPPAFRTPDLLDRVLSNH
ncbi:hypothetical protein Tco_1464369, partial [Tanacetum coccineum]